MSDAEHVRAAELDRIHPSARQCGGAFDETPKSP